jgi:endonuclease III
VGAAGDNTAGGASRKRGVTPTIKSNGFCVCSSSRMIGRPIPIADGPVGDAQSWCVAAVLTANAKNTTGSGPAFLNLCSMGGPADWAELSLATVEKLIKCKGCYVEAAKAVLQVCGALPAASLGKDGKDGYWTNSALEKLARDGAGLEKKVKGLGEKTASCVYLYYAHHASHFVIDINCLRFLVDCGLQPTPREQSARSDNTYPDAGGLKNPTKECRTAAEEMKAAFGRVGLQLPFQKVFRLSIAMNIYSQMFKEKGLGRCGMAYTAPLFANSDPRDMLRYE